MICSSASAVLLFAATAATQGQVFVVDDEAGAGVDFTDLQLAIDLASDGDLILVKEGSFGLCWLDDRALTVCAEAGAHVSVNRLIISDLAPGKVVRVQGIRSELQTPFSPCLLTANAGRVWIEDGVFEPAHEPFPGATFGSTGVFMTDCADVALVNVHVRGQTLATTVTSPFMIPPGRGMYVDRSTVDAFGCTIEGGNGSTFTVTGAGTSTTSPWETLYVRGPSKVHLSASAVYGGKGGPTVEMPSGYCLLGEGGFGIHAFCALGCPELSLQETIVVGGMGGDAPVSSACPGGPDGEAMELSLGTSLFESASPALTMEAASPVRESTLLDVVLHGPPQALAFLGISASPDSLFVPALAAPLVLAAPILGLQLGVIPGTGELSIGFPLLELPPGIASLVFHGQAAYLDPENAVVLGQPGMVVLLDAAL